MIHKAEGSSDSVLVIIVKKGLGEPSSNLG